MVSHSGAPAYQSQNLLSVRTWEFKSPRPHQLNRYLAAFAAPETQPSGRARPRRDGCLRRSKAELATARPAEKRRLRERADLIHVLGRSSIPPGGGPDRTATGPSGGSFVGRPMGCWTPIVH